MSPVWPFLCPQGVWGGHSCVPKVAIPVSPVSLAWRRGQPTPKDPQGQDPRIHQLRQAGMQAGTIAEEFGQQECASKACMSWQPPGMAGAARPLGFTDLHNHH